MSVFLVSPNERELLTNAGDRPPLGLMYLSAALNGYEIDNKIFDLNHVSMNELLKEVRIDMPEVVGITGMSPTVDQMREIAVKVRDESPSTRIVAGGFHVTNMPGTLTDVVDKEITGYGENEFVSYVLRRKVPDGFDIDQFPIPNRDGMIPEKYGLMIGDVPATIMVTGRGCPYNCCFCGNFDKKPKSRSIENVMEELDIIKEQGYGAVYLVDDSFGIDRRHAKLVSMALKERGLIYRVETRASLIDDEFAGFLAFTGCKVVGMGIESGSDKVLVQANKMTNTAEIRNAVQLLGSYGISTKGFFIFGLPGETLEDAFNTIEFAREMKRHGMSTADFYVLTPFPGCPVNKDPASFGITIEDQDYTKYLSAGKRRPTCFINNSNLSARNIEDLAVYAKERFNE